MSFDSPSLLLSNLVIGALLRQRLRLAIMGACGNGPTIQCSRVLFAMAVTPEQDVLSFVAKGDAKRRLSRLRAWWPETPLDHRYPK
jgi:hypothetical protein